MCDEIKKYIPKVSEIYEDEHSNIWLKNENLFYNGVYNQLDLKLADKDKNKY